jgi:hypothetical protein
MKIEFLKEGSPDCPLIRIYGNEPLSAAKLASAFRQLADGKTPEIAIHEIPGFQATERCLLFARLNHEDFGVRPISDEAFECMHRAETWKRLAELVEPFTEPLPGVRFQWLDETSNISLLISNSESGEW